jgi:Zn-dependent protease
MPLPLATANWSSPIFWAIMIGWIISVTLHEFAHGVVAYIGGDYTIKQRGLLTLNPLKYANPMMTIVLPLLFVAMGGIPMVGAATYVNTQLLRNRAWRSAVAAAGPAVNLILFGVCVAPLCPWFGWVNPEVSPADWTPGQIFCGAMGVIQFFAALINLIPLPPLDGFNIVRPYLPGDFAAKVRDPQISVGILIVLFFILGSRDGGEFMFGALKGAMNLLHVDLYTQECIFSAYDRALFGPNR